MKIRKAVFPAAGFGTRFLPATKASPKEMLPIVDTPLIDLAVREAKNSGIEQIIIVTGRGKGAIENYFDKSYELEKELEAQKKFNTLKSIKQIYEGIEVVYIRQRNIRGLGDAVLTAKNIIGNEPFAVLLADDVIFSKTPCLKQMISTYDKKQSSILALMEVPNDQISSYGSLDVEKKDGNIIKAKGMVEKPLPEKAPSNYAIIGRYILTSKIFSILEKTAADHKGEVQLTDAIRGLLETEDVYGYLFEGQRFDAGNKLGFLKATIHSALERKNLEKELRKYLKEIL